MGTSKSKAHQLFTVAAECLVEAGLFSTSPDTKYVQNCIADGADLLPSAIESWISADENLPSRATALRQLTDIAKIGSALTLGLSGAANFAATRWLGLRLAWWPSGICDRRRVALISSRIGRRLDEKAEWFTLLRHACARIDSENDILFTTEKTAANQFVARAAKLFGIPSLQLETPRDDRMKLGRWLQEITREKRTEQGNYDSRVFLSPPIDSGIVIESSLQGIPLRDRAQVAFTDQVLAISVRKNGHVHKLLESRLDDEDFPPGSVFLAVGPGLTDSKTEQHLMERGAVGWLVNMEGDRQQSPRTEGVLIDGPRRQRSAEIIEPPSSEDWRFLTHCTRRRDGPWPDQSSDEFVDDLILERRSARHSALAALARVINARKLIANTNGIRGRTPVVSFSAVRLDELLRLRTFRSHRARWDFEPYGICIAQSWLQDRGASAVCYGDDDLWNTLSGEQQPFFQPRTSITSKQVMDWTVEQEWRHVGDVDLRDAPHDAAFVFVPTREEAELVADISRWPVAVVGELD
jgi:hypothetical protein